MKYSNMNNKEKKQQNTQNTRTSFSKEFMGKLHDIDTLTEKAYSNLT